MKKHFLVIVVLASLAQGAYPVINPKQPLKLGINPQGGGSRFISRLKSLVIGGVCGVAINGSLKAAGKLGCSYLCAGLVGALSGFVAMNGDIAGSSVSACLENFAVVYNDFLVEPLLSPDDSVFTMQLRTYSRSWQLVDVVSRLEWLMRDILTTISYGEKLIASSIVQAEGREVMDLLSLRISALREMLEVATVRVQAIKNDPLFTFQQKLKDQYDSTAKLIGDRAREIVEQEYLANQLSYSQSPYFVSPSIETDYCGLCAQQVLKKERYATKCQCVPGNYFYHHACISNAVKRTGNLCPQCYSRATVHSAFGDGGVAAEQMIQQPITVPVVAYAPEPTAPPVDIFNTCALCSGNIPHKKRYKTNCERCVGKYYHHECVAGTIKQNGGCCPFCGQQNTVVHSVF
ncbi:hypothetical protein FJ366_03980 [Candidatus Dependentiae bacterium]|nr:hypothetical protein [Candidatus Dependentiae bacterium]